MFNLHSNYKGLHRADKPSKTEKSKVHYWFTIVSRNGQVLMQSETYTRKSSAVDGMKAVQGTFKMINQSYMVVYMDHTGSGKPIEKEAWANNSIPHE